MTEVKEIFGMLSTIGVELPYETKEEQQRADETNEKLKNLGFKVGRVAYDWGFRDYNDTVVKNHQQPPQKFQSGDLVKIFKTVTDGDVQWQDTIDLDYSAYHHGYQKGLAPDAWKAMFMDCLPVRMERGSKVIYGSLEPYFETGTEGVIWSVQEYGKTGYDGLHCLEDGDKLTVYSCVRDGDVEWQGRLDFGPEQVAQTRWVETMRETNHMTTEQWLDLSWQHRPVVIIKGPICLN